MGARLFYADDDTFLFPFSSDCKISVTWVCGVIFDYGRTGNMEGVFDKVFISFLVGSDA